MSAAAGTKQIDDWQNDAITATIRDGGALLFDITQQAAANIGDSSEAGERIFLLASPQIVIATD
jgi:hypothetical protein